MVPVGCSTRGQTVTTNGCSLRAPIAPMCYVRVSTIVRMMAWAR